MKNKRQEAILSIISSRSVDTQEELARLLNEQGFNATQATISRDIRELKLDKISDGIGGRRYAVGGRDSSKGISNYKHVLNSGVISIEHSENIIVIRTVSGMAMAIAAVIDNLTVDEIMGCIAGDDTIFVAIRHKEQAVNVIEMLRSSDGLHMKKM